jgi:hypothetical protein
MSIFNSAVTSNFQPGIVRQGAQLLLDAGDPRSYASGSTSWFDLSGNGNTATLSGNLQNNWVNQFGGYFDFPNDSTRFATVTQSPSVNNCMTRDFTLELWWTVDAAAGGNSDNIGPWTKGVGFFSNPGGAILSGRDTGNAFAGTLTFYVNGTSYRGGGTNANDKIWPVGYTGGFATNTWACTQLIRRGNTLSLFSNLRNCWDLSFTVSIASNTNNISIGRGRTDFPTANYPLDGKMMAFIWYNRALSLPEMRQNYNTMASRVGDRLSPF